MQKEINPRELVGLAIKIAVNMMEEPALVELRHDIGFNAAMRLAATYASSPDEVERAMEAMGYPVEVLEVKACACTWPPWGASFTWAT